MLPLVAERPHIHYFVFDHLQCFANGVSTTFGRGFFVFAVARVKEAGQGFSVSRNGLRNSASLLTFSSLLPRPSLPRSLLLTFNHFGTQHLFLVGVITLRPIFARSFTGLDSSQPEPSGALTGSYFSSVFLHILGVVIENRHDVQKQ